MRRNLPVPSHRPVAFDDGLLIFPLWGFSE
jgi:hypothetical protein